MSVYSTLDTQLFISSTTITSTTTTKTQYAALTWVEVLEVEDMGQYGDTASAITFVSLKDGRVRKFKGTRDGGDMAVVVGADQLDTGQIAMDAAQADDKFEYGFKVVIPNRVTSGGTDEVDYFRGRVMSNKKTVGASNQIIKKNYSIAVNSVITTVPNA